MTFLYFLTDLAPFTAVLSYLLATALSMVARVSLISSRMVWIWDSAGGEEAAGATFGYPSASILNYF